jgi:hypothetical protein
MPGAFPRKEDSEHCRDDNGDLTAEADSRPYAAYIVRPTDGSFGRWGQMDNAKRRYLPDALIEHYVNFNSINEPSCGFPPHFPRNSRLRLRVLRVNIPNVNLSHAKQQITTKRSRHVWRIVHGGVRSVSDKVLLIRMPALDEACVSATAACEKLYIFLNPAIGSDANPAICRLRRNLEARLTVKIRNRPLREFLPSDLPSKPFAWGR